MASAVPKGRRKASTEYGKVGVKRCSKMHGSTFKKELPVRGTVVQGSIAGQVLVGLR